MELPVHPVVMDSTAQVEANQEISNLIHKQDKVKASVAQFIDDKWKFASKY
jgi:hypothetical protein